MSQAFADAVADILEHECPACDLPSTELDESDPLRYWLQQACAEVFTLEKRTHYIEHLLGNGRHRSPNATADLRYELEVVRRRTRLARESMTARIAGTEPSAPVHGLWPTS